MQYGSDSDKTCLCFFVAAQAEIDDLEHLLAQLDNVDDDGQGQGDLLDDFVLSATQVSQFPAPRRGGPVACTARVPVWTGTVSAYTAASNQPCLLLMYVLNSGQDA